MNEGYSSGASLTLFFYIVEFIFYLLFKEPTKVGEKTGLKGEKKEKGYSPPDFNQFRSWKKLLRNRNWV